jgi:hypothetical protein
MRRTVMRASSLALAAAGLAGVVMPVGVAESMELDGTSGRARAEVRAGLGATYVALAVWALADGSPTAHRAVGAAWLGAGASRLTSLVVDRPRTDPVYWGSLALELGAGLGAVLASRRTH